MTNFVGKKTYAIVLIAVIAFTISLISSFQQVRKLDEEIDGRIRNSMWMLSQVEREYLRFIHTLDSYVNGAEDTSHNDIVLRMDIFWSRLPLLTESGSSSLLNKVKDVQKVAKQSILALQKIELAVKDLRRNDLDSYRFIIGEMEPLADPIHRALIDTSLLSDEIPSFVELRMQKSLQQGVISFIGVIFLGGALVFMQFSEVNRRRTLEEELRELATADSLTGTNNRRRFFELSDIAFHRIRRHHHPLSVLMMDLDSFKTVNDTHGHATGDEMLRKFVDVCSGLLRQEDIMGRLGGEEFAVTLPDEGAETARITAERLRKSFEHLSIPTNGNDIRTTVSIGVAELSAADNNFEDCLFRADAALYEAKNGGRNRVEMA